jgi:hypothetical protein
MTKTNDPTEQPIFSAGASFRVKGLALNFEELSRIFGITPTHTHRRGDRAIIDDFLPRDMWLFTSPLPKSDELELHLEWLAERVLPHKQYIISDLSKKAEVDVFCHKTCFTEQASLTVSAHALEIFTELSLKFDVSLIFLPRD